LQTRIEREGTAEIDFRKCCADIAQDSNRLEKMIGYTDEWLSYGYLPSHLIEVPDDYQLVNFHLKMIHVDQFIYKHDPRGFSKE
jgi:hypothetical protein